MRLNAMTGVNVKVWAIDTDPHPIQLKLGSLRYSLTRDQAIAFAAEIVAAVDSLPEEDTAPGFDIGANALDGDDDA